MPNETAQTSPQHYARICGVLYLYIIVAGTFVGLFVRPSLIVPLDAEATARNIIANEPLFRIGFSAELLQIASDVAVAMILYVLFRPVDRNIALLAAFMRLAADIVLGVSSISHFVALRLLGSADYLSAFEQGQRHTLALLAMNVHNDGYSICLVFFGFALLALGYLISRSDYFPKGIGVLLAIAGACYLINSYAHFMNPAFAATLSPAIFVPMFIAEFALAAWLIVKGVNVAKWKERAHAFRISG